MSQRNSFDLLQDSSDSDEAGQAPAAPIVEQPQPANNSWSNAARTQPEFQQVVSRGKQRSTQKPNEQPIDMFVLQYKTQECLDGRRCKHYCNISQQQCLNFHSDTERRRVPFRNTSGAAMHTACMGIEIGMAGEWDYMPSERAPHSAHNKTEMSYHPLLFRTVDCTKPGAPSSAFPDCRLH